MHIFFPFSFQRKKSCFLIFPNDLKVLNQIKAEAYFFAGTFVFQTLELIGLKAGLFAYDGVQFHEFLSKTFFPLGK